MSCIITIQDTPKLHCIFPDKVEHVSALAVFYTSESGKERMVVECVRLEHFECDTELGFNCKVESANRAEITLPESFERESGSFRCQIPGVNIDEANICRWPPARNLFSENRDLKDSTDAPGKIDDYSAEILGSITAIVIFVILLAAAIFLFKRKLLFFSSPVLPDSAKVALLPNDTSGGPQKTEAIPCISSPRLAHTMTLLEECYSAQIILSPEQDRLVNINNTEVPKLFLAGPPGTGKTVVLLLKGIQWLREGHDVHIVSTGWWSIVSCSMLCHLLLQIRRKLQADNVVTGQLHLMQYDFDKEMDTAVINLSEAIKNGALYLIADEARPEMYLASKTFWDWMMADNPDLHIWASSYYIRDLPAGWKTKFLTTPFRFPLTVLKEVEKEKVDYIKPYTNHEVSSYTDSPPVKQILHWSHGHTKGPIENCATCGQEAASFLQSIHGKFTVNLSASSKGSTSTNIATTSSALNWKDMLVLTSDKAGDDSAMVTALKQAHIPVRIMGDDDTEDVATARSDVVWLADGDRVRGIERKVVVCLGVDRENVRLCHMSRCTLQLVIIFDCPEDLVTI